MEVRTAALWLLLSLAAATRPAAGQEGGLPPPDPDLYRDTVQTDTPQPYRLRPFMVPGSEQVRLGDSLLVPAQYRLDYRFGQLWVDTPMGGQDLVVTYRTLPFHFRDVYQRRSIVAADDDSAAAVAVVEEASRTGAPADPFGNARLQRSGSITRGILAGNNRDVSVESGLRMQLAGEVAEGVNVQAVLTDENTPIQPEGTTQRLSEFDRVFMQVETPQGTAQLGDFDLLFTGTAFAGFNRKLQGITVFGDLPDPAGRAFGGGRAAVAGATARGIYRTQEIEPLDGVQGPYRLSGAAGEQFIIVIAGSEVVYLDGERMTRGETNDYVVDYQTGEVTFTPQRLITDDRRILVEFQYTTNQFTRTILGTQSEARFWQRQNGTARAQFGATFLREADSRDFNAELGLTSSDSLLLVETGDGLSARSGAEPVRFDPEAPYVQYRRETRLSPGGAVDTIFVALTQAPPDTIQVYRVRFSRVGSGNGAYRRVGRLVNGIQYEYVGEGQGEYDAIRLIPKPKQQRLVDLHGSFEPLDGLSFFGEWGRSLNDQNRLSERDAQDDVGDAFLAGIRLTPTRLPLSDGMVLSGTAQRRFTGAHFTTFDRTRPVEFRRRWNLLSRELNDQGGIVQGGDETVDEADLRLDVTELTNLQVELGRIDLGGTFEGARQFAVLQTAEQRWPHLNYQIEYIDSRDLLVQQDGGWLRQRATLRKPLFEARFVPRFEVEQERRQQRPIGRDSLARASFAFVEYRPGLAWTSEKLEAGAEVELRTEQDWAEGRLRDAARAWTVQTQFKYNPSRTFNTDATLGYRVREFEEYFRINERRENNASVVMLLNSRLTPWRRAVEANWFYEAQTERAPTLQEIYVRVGPEFPEAQFVWEDDGDGILEIDEFLPERTPNEGTYARTYIPSDSLASTINVQARLRFQVDPGRIWRQADERWKRWMARVTTRSTLEVLEKSREQDLAQIYLLNLSRFRSPETTLNGRLRVGQEVYLFRGEPRYGVDLIFSQLRGLTELTSGEETRFLNSLRGEGRYKPSTRWGIKLAAGVERNRTDSEQFASRRFDIESVSLEPEVSFNPSQALQLSTAVALAHKEDGVGARRAQVLRFPFEGRYAQVRRLQVALRAEVAHVQLEQPEGRAVGLAQYELTEGRGPGTSFLWGLNGQYAINSYLRATFSYDGRAPAEAPTLHTVRVQLSALF